MNVMKKSLTLACFILSACSVGPNYKAPETCIEESWVNSETKVAVSETDPITKWWDVFQDPLLNKYIKLSVDNNQEILTAMSNILQAKALKKVVASAFYPQIGADVNATKTYFSKNGPVFAIGPSAGSFPGTISNVTGLPFSLQTPQIQSLFNLLFDFSWEIDLFGKTRRSVEAANAEIESVIEEKNDLLISVMAEIARNYIELRSFQKQKLLLEENLSVLEKKAYIIRKQYELGYADKLDDENIQAILSSQKAKVPEVDAHIYQNIYILSVLTGSLPETLLNELLCAQPLPNVPENIAVGLKSDLLKRRPDVRRAERNLAAATAYIGVAVASFFPSLTLVGDGGLQSLALDKLFSWKSKTGAIGGNVNFPIFQGGKLKGNLEAKYAETHAAFHVYQQTVLKALEEAESSLMAFTQSTKTNEKRKLVTSHYQKITKLRTAQALRGLTSLVDQLNSESTLIDAKLLQLESKTSSLINLVSLYKALGGGTECF